MPQLLTLPVGNTGKEETWELKPNFRTQKQFEAFAAIARSPGFQFSCDSMVFEPDSTCKGYKGLFVWKFYANNQLCMATIYPNGTIKYVGDKNKNPQLPAGTKVTPTSMPLG